MSLKPASKIRIKTRAAALATALCALQPAWADTYDLVTDFSSTNGGSSPWSYGWNPDDGAGGYAFVPMDRYSSSIDAMSWNSAAHNVLGTPGIWKNLTSTTWSGVAPGQVSLHPAEAQSPHANGNAVIVRFTAPATADYWIYATFMTGDSGTTEAWMVRQANFATAIELGRTGGDTSAASNMLLQAGDTVDFVVGHYTDGHAADNTPLSLQITSAVPEPNPGALLAAGLLSLTWLRKRRA
jgi:hypothetical protein